VKSGVGIRVALLAISVAVGASFSGGALGPALASHAATSNSTDLELDSDGDGLTDLFEGGAKLDPFSADTDGDGLLDPAEDPDRDGLSNLAEQTFGTNPRSRDSDRDGTLDGADDANGDGIVDWKQQDARPLPDSLAPPLADSPYDTQCHRPVPGALTRCVGDPDGATRIALYGDSVAGEWIPALDRFGSEHAWRLENFTRPGCPSVHVDVTTDPLFNAACRTWRKASEAKLRSAPPDVVIVSNFSRYGNTPPQWRVGLMAAIHALPSASRVIVLADTPKNPRHVPTCLENHPRNIGVCEVARSVGIWLKHDHLEAAAARDAGAQFISMNPWVCPYALCPVVVGGLLVWRDTIHLTATYSRQLANALGALLPADLPR
jgi:hypothetical protein